jgi:chromosome segregation ATPase
MIQPGVALAMAACLAMTGCSSMEGRTSAEGAAIGLAAGGAAGVYVAKQKSKYATIESRIAGERQIILAAIDIAHAQVATSQAQLQLLDTELAELTTTRQDRRQALQTTSTMLAKLSQQRRQLQAQQAQLQEQLANQQAFITDTEQGVRRQGEAAQAAQLAQWRDDIPKMQAVVARMTDQIGEIQNMESRVQRVQDSYA